MTKPDRKRPLLCRIGLHGSTFTDRAIFFGGQRCNNCLSWMDRSMGERVELERELLTQASSGNSDTQKQFVLAALRQRGLL